MRDAGWYMDWLERRLFNRDAEGMLAERLGGEEVEWAAKAGIRPSSTVKAAFYAVDSWLDVENTLPSGPCVPPSSPDENPEDFGFSELRRFARMTQVLQLFNSFGVGVFVGGLHLVIAEAACEEGEDPAVGLASVLEILNTSPIRPDDLEDYGEQPWARRLERNMHEVRRRTSLNDALRPLAERHGFFRGSGSLLSSRRKRAAKRGMFLAGMMAAGLEPLELLKGDASPPARSERGRRRLGEAGEQAGQGPPELFFLSDDELERCLPEASIRADVEEELEFRLRNNRLSRMLAHLKRISRGQQEERDDDE